MIGPPSSSARDEVHRRAADADSILESLTLRMKAGKRRQERGMDVQDPIGECREEGWPDEAHEPGQANDVHFFASNIWTTALSYSSRAE